MKKLIVQKSNLKPIVLSLDISQTYQHLAESILATIWSYRKGEDGMYYSNEQLADLFWTNSRAVKRVMKSLRDAGLVTVKRRHNSSSIVKPSAKFNNLMGIEKGPVVPSERTGGPSGRDRLAPYTSSKEEEDTNTKSLSAVLAARPDLKKIYENRLQAGFDQEKLKQEILKVAI